MPRTIRSRLLLLALAWAVPMAVTSIAAGLWASRARLEAEEASNLDLARAAASSFQAYVDGLGDEAAILGAAASQQGVDREATRRLLARAAGKRPAVRWFLWADAAGKVIAASDPRAVGIDVSDRDYFRAIQAGAERALGGITPSRVDGQPVFGLAIAIRDERGALDHLVVAVVEPDRLDQRALAGLRPRQATVSVIDGNGRLVHRTALQHGGWSHRQVPVSMPLVARALAGEEATGIDVSDIERDRRVAAVVPAGVGGWVVRAATPVSVVMAPLWRDLAVRGAVVLVLALGGLVASVVIGRWIAEPLRRLSRQAAAWKEGRAVEPVDAGPDEVRAVSGTFVEMANGLALERRRLEAAMASLREADRRKDQFLAVLSHELRNPLAPIRNSLAILERVPPGSEPSRRSQAIIGRQVAHLTRLVDDLLDVSRIARGKIQLLKRPLDLAEVVRRAGEDHRAQFEDAGVSLTVAMPASPVPLSGDEVRLSQVLRNLLQNAARFTPRGGAVRLGLELEGDQAIVSVVDTGAGIAPEVIDSLFEPFTQGPLGPGRAHGGLGLGLALVKGIAVLHGGEVEAHSAGAGRGAEFRVRLPVAEPVDDEASPPVAGAPAAHA
ncbi:MAG: sensor histidine kinase [Anaeromyxobacteraceae bacterium]